MKLAIVGLRETFYYILRPYFTEAGTDITVVMGGSENEAEGAKLAGALAARHVESIAQVIALKPDGALVGDWYRDRPATIIPLLEAGIAVFSTKVVAAGYPETLKVITAAQKTGAILMSGSSYRHAPAVVQAITAVRAGEWGHPVYARMFMPHGMGPAEDRRDCGGMLTHYALHCLSPLVAILGGRVKRVHAFGGVFSHDKLATEDAGVISVQFDNSAMAQAEVISCQQPDFPATVPELDIHCTRKSVRTAFPEGPFQEWYGKPVYNPEIYGFACGYSRWMKIFKQAVEQNKPPVPYEEYIEVAAALHMARISRDEFRTVDRFEIEKT